MFQLWPRIRPLYKKPGNTIQRQIQNYPISLVFLYQIAHYDSFGKQHYRDLPWIFAIIFCSEVTKVKYNKKYFFAAPFHCITLDTYCVYLYNVELIFLHSNDIVYTNMYTNCFWRIILKMSTLFTLANIRILKKDISNIKCFINSCW